MHTHVIAAFNTTPYLWVRGLPGSGKSDLGEAVRATSLRAVHTYGPSIAGQKRFLESIAPGQDTAGTLIVDEIDYLLAADSRHESWSVWLGGYKRGAETLNAADSGPGIERRGLFYPRMFIGRHVAGFPDEFVARTIPVSLYEHSLDDEVTLMARQEASTLTAPAVQEMLRLWSGDDALIARLQRSKTDDRIVKRLRSGEPLRGRDAEVWGPLIVIAHDAGAETGERMRTTAVRTAAADDRVHRGPADDLDELLIEAFADVDRSGRHRVALGNWYDPKLAPIPSGADAELSNGDLGYLPGPVQATTKLAVFLVVNIKDREAELRFDSKHFDQIVRRLGSDSRSEIDPQRRRGAWTRDSALRAFDDVGRLQRNGQHRTHPVFLHRGAKTKQRCIRVDWSHVLWPNPISEVD